MSNATQSPTTTSQNDSGPRIYVACLSSYNAGILHGTWIDATQEPDAIHAEIKAMLKRSKVQPAEEFAIHDYEGFFNIHIGEYQSIESVAEHAQFAVTHGELGAKVIEALGSIGDAESALNDNYQGAFDSLTDWAEDFLAETGELSKLPDNLKRYFDYESYARDVEMSGDILTLEVGGQHHIFWTR